MATYDPRNNVATFMGQQLLDFAEDAFIVAERDEDRFTKTVGISGVTRNRNSNRSGTIRIKLRQSSPSNDVLSAYADLDERLGTGAGPFFVKDGNGTTRASAARAWIRKMPPGSQSKEADQDREWIFDCEELQEFVGGIAVP